MGHSQLFVRYPFDERNFGKPVSSLHFADIPPTQSASYAILIFHDPLHLQNRDYTIDIAKAILLYLVIFGHIMTIACPGGILIYAFHMPAFFILTGFVVHDSSSFLSLLKKLSNNLIKPYFYFLGIGTVAILIHSHFNYQAIFNLQSLWQIFYDMTPKNIHMSPGWFL